MEKRYSYRLHFYLNASHAMRWNNQLGEEHPHTWELICQVARGSDEHFIRFNEIEEQIQTIIDPLQGQFLNLVPPFDQEIRPLNSWVSISLTKLITNWRRCTVS